MILHLPGEKLLLNHGTVLEKLLYHVVAKNVYHQSIRIDHDFLKDPLPVITVCGGDLLLQEPRALLVTSKFNNASEDVLRQR